MKQLILLSAANLKITKHGRRSSFRYLVYRSFPWAFLFGVFLLLFYTTTQISPSVGKDNAVQPSVKGSPAVEKRGIHLKKGGSGSVVTSTRGSKAQQRSKKVKISGISIEHLLMKNPVSIQNNMIDKMNSRQFQRVNSLIRRHSSKKLTEHESKDQFRSCPRTAGECDQPSNELSPRNSSSIEDAMNKTCPSSRTRKLCGSLCYYGSNLLNLHAKSTIVAHTNNNSTNNSYSFLDKELTLEFDQHQPSLPIISQSEINGTNSSNKWYFSERKRATYPTGFNSENYSDRHFTSQEYIVSKEWKHSTSQLCGTVPPELEGKIEVNLTLLYNTSLEDILKNNTWVFPGGFWTPAEALRPCLPRHRVAIIVPYRDRIKHLAILMSQLHPFLRKQQLEYTIFVVEQEGNSIFNKGSVMNAGFLEAWKLSSASCFIFHDVDLLPEDDRNMYSCPSQPRHLSVAVDTFKYILPYKHLVGGVLGMRGEHFFQVNGYSNLYWGWGGEDDDMSNRIKRSGLSLTRPPKEIARYTMMKHTKRRQITWKVLSRLLKSAGSRMRLDGLNTIKYELKSLHIHPLFTHLVVNVGEPPEILMKKLFPGSSG